MTILILSTLGYNRTFLYRDRGSRRRSGRYHSAKYPVYHVRHSVRRLCQQPVLSRRHSGSDDWAAP